jgi:hypothetical protein
LWLIKEARKKIIEGNFIPWKNKIVNKISVNNKNLKEE